MGLPALNIIFQSAAREAAKRAERGVVGMIIKDANVPEQNPAIVYKKKDIPEKLSAENKAQIELALKGNTNTPSKVVVYVLGASALDYKAALAHFALKKVNWLACPSITTDKQEKAVADWIKEQRKGRNKVKAVLPNQAADDEGVINFATTDADIDEKKYTTEQFCSRIAGLIAGTPLTESATFVTLPEVTGCTIMDREAADAAIDAGKFIIFYDGEKVKTGRAVNSLTTLTPEKQAPWQKIKVVDTMDMIHDDLILLVEEYYIGKYTNIFDHKCLLLTAIKEYFEELARIGVLDNYNVDFDVDAIRDYLVLKRGFKRDAVEAMPDAEVKKQYTDEKVFLKADVTIADVMEDVTLKVEM